MVSPLEQVQDDTAAGTSRAAANFGPDGPFVRFVHMDFSYSRRSSHTPEFWFYALNRRDILFEQIACEMYCVNVGDFRRCPIRIGDVRLDGLLANRLWLDRSGANFYGISLRHPEGTSLLHIRQRYFFTESPIRAEDGQVYLMRIKRHSLLREELAFAGAECLWFGEWCSNDARWHFHFLSDQEAILVIGETKCENSGAFSIPRYFVRSHVYRIHIDTVRSTAFLSKIEFSTLQLQYQTPTDRECMSDCGQIYVRLVKTEEQQPHEGGKNSSENIVVSTLSPLFYTLDMLDRCFFYNECSAVWEQSECTNKERFCLSPEINQSTNFITNRFNHRERSDRCLLLSNNGRQGIKQYARLEICSTGRFYKITWLMQTKNCAWLLDKTGSMYCTQYAHGQLRAIYSSPPLVMPLKYLAYWRLKSLFGGKECGDVQKAIPTQNELLILMKSVPK